MPRGVSDTRREHHGATCSITRPDPGENRHAGEPMHHLLADVSALIIPGASWALPVSQAIGHGPEQSREHEFERRARQAAADLAAYHAKFIFKDRRGYGRRFRPTDNVDELMGPQEPYPKGHQADIPFERYLEF